MATIPKVVITDKGRGAQLKTGPGNNQYVRVSDFNPSVDAWNSIQSDNTVAVTQATSNTTGVTANSRVTKVTLFASATYLATGVVCSFTLTNSSIAANSVILSSLSHAGTAAGNLTVIGIIPAAGSAVVYIRNQGTGNADTSSTPAVLSLIVL